jgi:aspartyl-tRNA(Asn)/glutamyl-tRNA(Gln) amidotransferase subunit B
MNTNKNYNNYEAVIGIEIHVQLNTEEKLFCYCSNIPLASQNTNICPICCGYPGTLPLLNKEAITSAIKCALGINAKINPMSMFARKHYFYADLPKGYQISQHDKPFCEEGYIHLDTPDKKKISIQRMHIEEDAGKNIHEENESLINLNRAGTPLLEIVSYPDLSSPEEVSSYLKIMHGIMTTLGITTGSMEEGAFRADTNISVRKKGETKLGTKCELKNINSFKFIKDATEYEINRQINLLEKGEKIVQQTRLWDTKKKESYPMREKETVDDYHYLEDPDLPPVYIREEDIETIRKEIPELPQKRQERFEKEYQLLPDDAKILSSHKDLGAYFEAAYATYRAKGVVQWILRELLRKIKEEKLSFEEIPFSSRFLGNLVKYIDEKKVTRKTAIDVFEKTFRSGEDPIAFIKKHNLETTLLSLEEIEKIVIELLQKNPETVKEYKEGKTKAKGFLMGIIMKQTGNSACPQDINKILSKALR